MNKISEAIDYEPVIGVMGKTGAGKSSVCNALFKGEVCAVSDVEACTREVQELRIRFGKHSLKIIDIPGVSVRMPSGIRSMKIYTAICFPPWILSCG
ncbi:50S ribosome-binding GTPase [Escherichia coli]|nr:50S ribosome-binding GTPase [Escherichia coli]